MHKRKVVSAIAVLLAVLMVLSLVISVLPATAHAVSQSDLDAIRRQKDEVAGQRMACQEKIDKLKEQQALVLEQKAALDERNEYTEQQLVLVQKEIDLYTEMIEDKSKEVDEAKAKEDAQLERYRGRVRAMEENGGYDILGIILQADSLSDMLTALDDMGEIMESDKTLEEQYIAAREEHESILADYEELKADCEEKQADLREEKKELEEQLQEAYELLAELEEDIDKAVKEYEAALAAEAAMAAQISSIAAQIAREAAERAQQAQQDAQNNGGGSTDGGSGNGDSGSSGGGESSGGSSDSSSGGGSAPDYSVGTGSFAWPLPSSNLVTSRYGWRMHPITGTERFHSGIDINGYGNEGAPILASDGGTVCTAEYSSSYGNYVMIDHGNGNLTLYAHMSGIAVSNGQQVSQGQTIGYVGHTGWATGDHLHFEIFIGGERVDPESIFGGLPHYDC